jgi:hypothetical protein
MNDIPTIEGLLVLQERVRSRMQRSSARIDAAGGRTIVPP